MKSKAIVTLADSNYYDLLLELIASIKSFEQSKNISICVLDAGLKENQIKNLIRTKGAIPLVIMKYIENPLIISFCGALRKFDIR